MKNKEINKAVSFINEQSDETRVYLGVDSERVHIDGTWHVDYLLAIVVHINGCNAAKVFGFVERELDHDRNLSKPKIRLMSEVYKIAALYLEITELVAHDVSIHLDINPNEVFGSSCVISEAMGYIKGVCGITPSVKPEAWAASIVADRLKSLVNK